MALDDLVVWLIATNWQLGIMAVCGVFLLVVFYHDTRYWRSLKGIVMTLFLGAGMLLGVLLGVLVLWPVLQVVFYWSPSRPDILALATMMVALIAALAFVGKVFRAPGVEMFRIFSGFLLLVTACCAVGIAAVTMTSSMVLTYPHEVGQLIGPAWSRFRDFAVVWLLGPILTAITIHMIAERELADVVPAVPTLPPLIRKRTKPTASALARKAIGRRDVRVFLKALGLILLISLMIVPLDQKFILFVPKVSTGQEKPYSSTGCPTMGHLMLVRLANGTNRFYQLMESTYTVQMPSIHRLVEEVYVSNPSNFSGIARDSLRTPDIDVLSAQGSTGVSISLQGSPGPVTGILANLTMVSDPMANFTLFYSQEFLRRNVTVDSIPRRIDNVAHSYVYSFIIKNNEYVCVTVSRIEVPELRRNEVNSTEVKVYVEGNLWQATYVDINGVHFSAGYLYSGKTMNVTLVLPMKEV